MWWGGEWPRAAGSSGCVANFCDPRDWTAGGGGFDLSPLLADCRKQEQVHPTLGCPLHCFTGRWEVADSWLQAYPGSKLGITPLVTKPHAREVQEVARRVPLCRLLLETDAPYFLPRQVSQGAAYRHSFAMPGHVVHVAAQIAALRAVPVQEVLRANRRNIAEVYGIDMSS